MSYSSLLKTLTNLGSPKILLVGDFMLDSYIYGDALRISPEAPVQVLKVVKKEYECGGAGSVAADITTLGAQCLCVGVIGNDHNGRILLDKLQATGADVSGIVSLDDRPTISKERLVGLAQHRHRQQLLRIDEEDTRPFTSAQYDQLMGRYLEYLTQADVVCLQDYNKGILEENFCRKLIEKANAAGKKVLVDPPYAHPYDKFAGACLITPNRKETSWAVGYSVETMDDAARAAKTLKQRLQLDAAVITLDKEGSYLQTDTIAEQVPTIARNVYDVTGAGDMMLAMLAVAVAGDCDYRTALRLANIASGIEVEKFGVATVTIDEMVNEIISRHRGKSGKIREIAELVSELDYHRKLNEKIVFTNGCFDVLHRGHIEYLNFCKQQGDVVVLGLNSDSSVRQLKGPERPINNQHDRAAVLAALESIDYIVIFDELTPLETIMKVRPDFLIKGEDWKDKGVVGQEFVESYGGQMRLAKMVQGKSSTNTINKMKAQAKLSEKE